MATAHDKEGGERGDGSRPVWKDHNLHLIWGATLYTPTGVWAILDASRRVGGEHSSLSFWALGVS